MINVPTVLCTSSYKDIKEGHFAQAKENKKRILQNRKKKVEVWFEAYSGVFQARWEQKWESKCQERGASVTGRNAQIFQIYFEGNI